MTNQEFIETCVNVGINKAIALSTIKWYSKAVKEDSSEVITLLFELSSFYDTLTVCKRLKMYALNRLERGKQSASIEDLKGIVDAVIENNGNENRTERAKDTESIEQLTESGWTKPFFDSHFEQFESYEILADLIYFIRQHNIFNRWVDVDDFDTKTAIGQSNSRDIKKDIAKVFDFMGNKLNGARITPSNMVKLCQIAKYGYLAA